MQHPHYNLLDNSAINRVNLEYLNIKWTETICSKGQSHDKTTKTEVIWPLRFH